MATSTEARAVRREVAHAPCVAQRTTDLDLEYATSCRGSPRASRPGDHGRLAWSSTRIAVKVDRRIHQHARLVAAALTLRPFRGSRTVLLVQTVRMRCQSPPIHVSFSDSARKSSGRI